MTDELDPIISYISGFEAAMFFVDGLFDQFEEEAAYLAVSNIVWQMQQELSKLERGMNNELG